MFQTRKTLPALRFAAWCHGYLRDVKPIANLAVACLCCLQASKLDKLAATGRFGLGFNAGELNRDRVVWQHCASRRRVPLRAKTTDDFPRLIAQSRGERSFALGVP